MTKEQFEQALINTKARFPEVSVPQNEGDIEPIDNYVHLSERKGDQAYYGIIYRQGYNKLPEKARIFFETEIDKYNKL